MSRGIVGEYLALKRGADADLLAMQVGDFYEFFAADAETVAEELDLKLSRKSSGGDSYPMAGVPVDDLHPHLVALVERGYRVAVADQHETDDGHAREVVRVVTPGTLTEPTDAGAQYLATVAAGERYGLAFVDVTTGEFLVTAVPDAAAVRSELHRFDPAELLPGPEASEEGPVMAAVGEADATVTEGDPEAFAPGRAAHRIREQFGRGAAEAVGLDAGAATTAAGAALAYVDETRPSVAASITRLRAYEPDDHVALDATTQRNLELVETMRGDADGSLLGTIDRTVTTPGRRRLREWLTRPRRSRGELERRLDAVEALASAALARDRLREQLGAVADLERLASRAASGNADARDLLSVRDTLATVPRLRSTVEESGLAGSPVAVLLSEPDSDAVREVRDELEAALVEDPPGTVTDGGVFRRGYDAELDELIDRHEELREWFDGLAEREKRAHDLSHVTVDRNRTDGYYIQVGKSVADRVPDHYRAVKTLKNSKRFTTDELDERERELLRVEESRAELERELFERLRGRVADRTGTLQDAGRALAEADALAALAEHAAASGWVRPELVEGNVLEVEAGRHPVVETTTDFVPNDLRLDRERGFLLVTGPNMSGKSTYMRQAALITLLAQAGSFVPADAATVGLVDGIYTRVGALDELADGRSTFMVEMQELSNILHSATEDSLVVLDEVGRGTATYDGVSIAWAATEYLANTVGARTLFATHYHELAELADRLPGVENVHLAVADEGDDVTFLRTVEAGPADRSYGVHVAEMAGVPAPVVSRSRDVLRRLREEEAIDVRGGDRSGQVVFDLGSGEMRHRGADRDEPADDAAANGGLGSTAETVIEEIERTDVNEVSPIELLSTVREWQRRLEGEE